jgi:hypothetical protein
MALIPESPEFKQWIRQMEADLMALVQLRGLLAENDERLSFNENLHRRKHSSETSLRGNANDKKSTCKRRLRKR